MIDIDLKLNSFKAKKLSDGNFMITVDCRLPGDPQYLGDRIISPIVTAPTEKEAIKKLVDFIIYLANDDKEHEPFKLNPQLLEECIEKFKPTI